MEELEGQLTALEIESGYGLSDDLRHQLELTQYKYKQLVEDAARLQYRARQHRLYEGGKLLAWLGQREERQE